MVWMKRKATFEHTLSCKSDADKRGRTRIKSKSASFRVYPHPKILTVMDATAPRGVACSIPRSGQRGHDLFQCFWLGLRLGRIQCCGWELRG